MPSGFLEEPPGRGEGGHSLDTYGSEEFEWWSCAFIIYKSTYPLYILLF